MKLGFKFYSHVNHSIWKVNLNDSLREHLSLQFSFSAQENVFFIFSGIIFP